MRKGLQLTLLTVALALISVQAKAMAPTIGSIPSPVVGNAEAATDGGNFIYIDAMDLTTLATDDSTAADKLMWTYYQAPGGHYLINGVSPVDLATANITSPTASQIINWTVGKGPSNTKLEWNVDGKANTITIRNQYLSPLGGTYTGSTNWADGIIPAEKQLVTFFCSDGTSYSKKDVWFYSSNNDYDRLSGSVWRSVVASDAPKPFGSSIPNTQWKPETWTKGVTSSTWAGSTTGMCIIAPLTNINSGGNIGEFASPAPYFNLAANMVYRIKLQMNSTQATPGKTPLWDFVVENTSPSGFGMMAYMQDTTFYDDPYNGGQNTVINTQNGDWKTIYWTPAPVLAPQWKQIFTTSYDSKRNPRLRFRILDVDKVGVGELKSGAICIQNIVIDSVPISQVRVLKTEPTSIPVGGVKQANATKTGNVQVGDICAPVHPLKITFANGAVTVAPTATIVPNSYINDKSQLVSSSSQDYAFAEIRPATFEDGNTDSDDNWPLTWSAPTTSDPNIYRLSVALSAPSPTDEQHPWDAIFMGMYSRTYEMFTESYITSRDRLGSPAYIVGADGTTIKPQTYTLFFQAGKGTKAPAANAKFKWLVRLANVPTVAFPSSNPSIDKNNTGAVTFHGITIDKVDFGY